VVVVAVDARYCNSPTSRGILFTAAVVEKGCELAMMKPTITV
jgi:hypothetical protein